MTIFSIADMSASLPTVYPEMVSQVQRKAPFLRLLSQLRLLKRSTTGNAMTWNVKFTGQAAAAANFDGGALVTATSDVPVPASLVFGTYDAPVKVTDRMQWVGGANGGLGADINSLFAPIEENVSDAIQAWVKLVNQQLYSGSGSSSQMVGLSTAAAATGSYASILQATYSGWAGTVVANGGVLRSLTLGLIKQVLRTIAAASAAGRPDIALCPPAIMDAVEALFDAYTRINYNPMEMGEMGGAQPQAGERYSLNPPMIVTAGGKINADGFRALHWVNQRLWFVEDPDCTCSGATNPNNVMYFVNSQEIDARFVPPPGASTYRTDAKQIEAAEQSMGALASMPLEMIPRGRTQHATELDISGMVGLRLRSRNAHGMLQDIQ